MAKSSTGQGKSGGNKLHRQMGLIGLLFVAVGSIIGSGWLFGELYAAEAAGPASIIGWVFGAVLMMFIALSFAELGPMFPVSGGVVRFPHFAFGSFASYTFGWLTWLSVASTTSIEVMAALQYSTSYFPWLETSGAVLTPYGFGVATGLLALFSVINVMGIHWLSRLNNVLVWWKLGIVCIVIAAFIITVFHGGHFSDNTAGGFFPYGWDGVFSAIATAGIAFSFLGFRQGIEFAGEAKNPHRAIPIAVIASILITGLIYVGLQIAFIGALPTDALVNGWQNIGSTFSGVLSDVAAKFGPLAAIAGFIGLTWLAVLLYIDAFISPADTGLIYSGTTTRISYAMGRNGNAPEGLAKVNKRGVPWISVILTFCIGTIFFLPFPGWKKIVGFVTSATVLSFGSGPVVMMALRHQIPKKERPFRLPFVNIFGFLGFWAANLIVYWSGWPTIWKLMIAILIGFILLAIYEYQVDDTPDLDYRSGIWPLAWFAGLTVLSWFGSYPDLSQHAGNLGLIGVKWEIPILAGFSFLIIWLAIKTRLPAKKVTRYIDEAASEMEDDDKLRDAT